MLDKFLKGLLRTREAFKSRFGSLFGNKEINHEFYDELEEILLTADVGVETTMKIIDSLKDRLKKLKVNKRSTAQDILKDLLVEILNSQHNTDLVLAPEPPTIFLILGVNGVGKTTSIAKMRTVYPGREKVLLAAGDTFEPLP